MNNLFETVFNLVGMAHSHCINNDLLTTLIAISWAYVGVSYLIFVGINNRIRKAKKEQGQLQVDETFKWFKWVFITCALMRFINVITLYWGVYGVQLIIELANVYAIWKAVKVYRDQESLFKMKAITELDVQYAEDEAIEKYRSELVKKATEKGYGEDLLNVLKQ